ncbi:MAG: hypothetical protein K9N35_04930 [Candidatus Marinimicrobia bacterium]|nr:hypothetical protein [Candidatus Neomarinimicrobiota bacterium]
MLTDSIVEELHFRLKRGESLASISRRLGICYSTAHKYKNQNRLPSEIKALRHFTAPHHFDDDWELLVVPLLEEDPRATSQKILNFLIKHSPNKFNQSMLRTLQRRLAEWRAKPYKTRVADSIAPDDPDDLFVTGYLEPPISIYIRGHLYEHSLFFGYFPKFKWIFLAPTLDYSHYHILDLFEEALWKSDISPRTHYHHPTRLEEKFISPRFTGHGSYKLFCKHHHILPVEKDQVFPPRWRELAKAGLSELSSYIRDKRKSQHFDSIAEYESTVRFVCKQHNHNIPEDIQTIVFMKKTRSFPKSKSYVKILKDQSKV